MFRSNPHEGSSEVERFQAFDPSEIITRLGLAKMAEEEAYQREKEAERLERLAKEARAWDRFLRYCRPATAEDYAGWLKGYMYHHPDSTKLRFCTQRIEDSATIVSCSIGPEGVIEHEDPLADIAIIPRARCWILTNLDHMYIPEVYGASSSFDVIIPADAKLTPEIVQTKQVGDNCFYFMADYSTNSEWIEVYADVAEVFDRA